MKYSQVEQETIILFNEGEPSVTIYTHNERLKNQLFEYMEVFPDKVTDKNFDEESGAFTCSLPKRDLRISFKKQRSESQIAAAMRNMERMQRFQD